MRLFAREENVFDLPVNRKDKQTLKQAIFDNTEYWQLFYLNKVIIKISGYFVDTIFFYFFNLMHFLKLNWDTELCWKI